MDVGRRGVKVKLLSQTKVHKDPSGTKRGMVLITIGAFLQKLNKDGKVSN